MKFLIPSYKRSESMTSVDALRSAGVRDDDIVIGVQTDEDMMAYSECFPGLTIIQGEAHNAAGNRNTLLRYVKNDGLDYAVFLDDDITEIEADGIYETLESDIEQMHGYNAAIMSWNTIIDGADLEQWHGKMWLDFYWSTQFNLFDVQAVPYFDESFDIMEDTDWSYQVYDAGLHTLYRFDVLVEHGESCRDGDVEGGCRDAYETSNREQMARMLVTKHKGKMAYTRASGDVLILVPALKVIER